MPNKDAAIKSLRQNKKRADRNSKNISDVDAVIRKTRLALASGDAKKATEWLRQAIKQIDKAAQRGSLKKNTAARKKSRLSAAVARPVVKTSKK
jgi:small subunit ribosomal protein S20